MTDLPTDWADNTGMKVDADYLNALDGKVNRLIEAVINVTDYGATGDGTTDDTTAINNAYAAAVAAHVPLYFPAAASYYKTTASLLWTDRGLRVFGDGQNVSRIYCAGTNMPVVKIADSQQHISGLDLGYTSQRPNTESNSACIMFGTDNGAKQANLSVFENLLLSRGSRGMMINTGVTSLAGMFNCIFVNVNILGYTIDGINLNSGNDAGAMGSGAVFINTYVKNNYTGSVGSANGSGVFLKNWNEVVFSQLNVEHVNLTAGGAGPAALRVANSDHVVVNGFHTESVTLSGNGTAFIFNSSSRIIVNGWTRILNTLSGTAVPTLQFAGSNAAITVNGLKNRNNTNTSATRVLAAFGSATNAAAWLNNVDTADNTATSSGGDATDRVVFDDRITTTTVPATATSTGTAGVMATDGTNLYVCTAANTWRRVALSSW